MNPDATWHSSTALVPPQLRSQNQASSSSLQPHQHISQPWSGMSPATSAGQTEHYLNGVAASTLIETHMDPWRGHSMLLERMVIGDNYWSPPPNKTVLQVKINHSRILPGNNLLNLREKGVAKFYNAAGGRPGDQALIRYARFVDLTKQMPLKPHSTDTLHADRTVWNKTGLRILLVQSPVVAYGIADAQLVKDVFPGLSAKDQEKLPDGSVAMIQIEKRGKRGYIYQLYSVFNPEFFKLVSA
ncbi:uncharacterized protein UHOD_07692 [Ustilago sp. UG-2017b]|nr:uncharacterized protein UHOD_07692 [Ustilago sp. UG-2017b]